MRLAFTLLSLSFIITANSFSAKAQATDITDSLALVDLYNNTNGPGWSNHDNWLNGPVNTWYGVTVESMHVTSINLDLNKLTGNIPASIGNLTHLVKLQMAYNMLSGAIPNSIGSLSNLQVLYLYNNNLSGTIPSSIGNLSQLVDLQLWINKLTGNIPSSIGNLANLQVLSIGSNQLSGSIPSVITSLTNLQDLSLYSNLLTGTIPSNIGNLTKLRNLVLSGNKLTGSIPSSIGNLTLLRSELNLSRNQLTGPIPESIGNLTKLRYLFLDFNQLSGSIPESVSKLVSAFNISLRYNRLSGSIPASLGKLRSLSSLYLDSNQLSGTIPASLGNIGLSTLNLSYNRLTGPIPSAGKFINIYEIKVDHNQLYESGFIFSQVTNKTSLYDISYNRFTFNLAEPLARLNIYSVYSPQAPVAIHKQGNTLSVSAGGTLNKNTYKWFKQGSADSTVINADSSFTPTTNGKYYVKITNAVAKNLTLYSDTINFTLNNLIADNYSAANADNKLKQAFKVFPNPANTIVHVQINGSAIIIVSNVDGKTMLTKSINNSGVINVGKLAAGTYFIQNKTTAEAQKIVVVH